MAAKNPCVKIVVLTLITPAIAFIHLAQILSNYLPHDNMNSINLTALQVRLREIYKANNIKNERSKKAQLVEFGFLQGCIAGKNNDDIRPIVAVCLMSGRSILSIRDISSSSFRADTDNTIRAEGDINAPASSPIVVGSVSELLAKAPQRLATQDLSEAIKITDTAIKDIEDSGTRIGKDKAAVLVKPMKEYRDELQAIIDSRTVTQINNLSHLS